MRLHKFARGVVLSALGAVAMTHCISDGGFNQHERAAGGGDNGVDVAIGELAIDPTGKYLLSMSQSQLIYAALDTAEVRTLDGLSNTERVTFDHAGSTLFVTRATPEANVSANAQADSAADGSSVEADVDVDIDLVSGKLMRYDVTTQRELWSHDIELGYSWNQSIMGVTPFLAVSEDDRHLIAAYDARVDVVDAATGALRKSLPVPDHVIDVDIAPAQKHVVITHAHTWRDTVPNTVVEVVDLETFARIEIDVPNCSDELVISKDGKYGLLAPTRCQRDPVSVIDLESGKFVRNLPGFGPVALAADGALAVAFIDAYNIDEALFDDPKQIPDESTRYHLMLIDTKTLRFDVIELGDALPRYALTPDGKLLLVDSQTLWDDGRIRVLDVAAKKLAPVLGPSVQLDHYAVTSDSSRVFLLDDGLYSLTLADRRVTAALIDFTPTHLNLTPDDRRLVLREDDHTLRLYDTHESELLRTIRLDEGR